VLLYLERPHNRPPRNSTPRTPRRKIHVFQFENERNVRRKGGSEDAQWSREGTKRKWGEGGAGGTDFDIIAADGKLGGGGSTKVRVPNPTWANKKGCSCLSKFTEVDISVLRLARLGRGGGSLEEWGATPTRTTQRKDFWFKRTSPGKRKAKDMEKLQSLVRAGETRRGGKVQWTAYHCRQKFA